MLCFPILRGKNYFAPGNGGGGGGGGGGMVGEGGSVPLSLRL